MQHDLAMHHAVEYSTINVEGTAVFCKSKRKKEET